MGKVTSPSKNFLQKFAGGKNEKKKDDKKDKPSIFGKKK